MNKNKITLLVTAILISTLSQASQDPIDVVSREEFNALKDEFSSLKTEVNSLQTNIATLTESIANLSTKLDSNMDANNQRVTELDERMQRDYVSTSSKGLMVDGDYETFYPVVFHIDTYGVKIQTFQLTHYVHNLPAGWDGYMRFYAEIGGNSFSGRPGYTEAIAYNYGNASSPYVNQTYIAKFRQGGHGAFFVVWLRGGVQYDYQETSPSNPIVIKERTDITALGWGSEPGGKNADWVEPTKEIDAHMVPNGFRRWDPSTYGSYHASVAQPQQAAASIFPLINK